MPVTERARHHAYTKLTETVGAEAADVIMELLPIHPTADLVTRTDFQAGIIRLQGEMAEVRAELRGEMAEVRAELRGEMADLRTELRGEMTDLRTELQGDMAELRSDLRDDMAELRTELQVDMAELRSQLLGTSNDLENSLRGEMARMYRWGAGVVGANAIAVVTALMT